VPSREGESTFAFTATLFRGYQIIDRNSLFQRRGRARDTSTAKRLFHGFTVTRGAETQMAGSLATFALIAEQFLHVPVRPTVFISRDDSKRHPRIPCDIHGDFEIFQIACVTIAAAGWVAIDCFRCRRPRAWRDANAMIANLIHSLVYAPGANMPQDAHLVRTLRTQQRIDLPDLLDQLAPRSRRNAPRLERTMLDRE